MVQMSVIEVIDRPLQGPACRGEAGLVATEGQIIPW